MGMVERSLPGSAHQQPAPMVAGRQPAARTQGGFSKDPGRRRPALPHHPMLPDARGLLPLPAHQQGDALSGGSRGAVGFRTPGSSDLSELLALFEQHHRIYLRMSFLSPDFLLESDAARTLYHTYAAPEPILDYHCHLPPDQIAADHRFADLAEIWLAGDHYKWRAMRANGVAEAFCTGSASPWEKFLAYARTVPRARSAIRSTTGPISS